MNQQCLFHREYLHLKIVNYKVYIMLFRIVSVGIHFRTGYENNYNDPFSLVSTAASKHYISEAD